MHLDLGYDSTNRKDILLSEGVDGSHILDSNKPETIYRVFEELVKMHDQ
jgi:hypothetical protein